MKTNLLCRFLCLLLLFNVPPLMAEETPLDLLGANNIPESENIYAPDTTPHLALLLPQSGKLQDAAKFIQAGFLDANNQAKINHATAFNIQIYDTAQMPLEALYRKALAEGASAIVGPLEKEAVNNLSTINITQPTLALNENDASQPLAPELFEFALSPQNEAMEIAHKAFQDGKTHVLIIAPDAPWSQLMIKQFALTWDELGGIVSDTLLYRPQTSLQEAIKNFLAFNEAAWQAKEKASHQTDADNTEISTPIHRQDADMIFLIASPEKARSIVPLLKYYFANDLPVYASSLIHQVTEDIIANKDLEGVLFCDIPLLLEETDDMKNARNQIANENLPVSAESLRLYAVGRDAYQIMTQTDALLDHHFEQAGMTGLLYLGDDQKIHTHLTWAEFNNGQVQIIQRPL